MLQFSYSLQLAQASRLFSSQHFLIGQVYAVYVRSIREKTFTIYFTWFQSFTQIIHIENRPFFGGRLSEDVIIVSCSNESWAFFTVSIHNNQSYSPLLLTPLFFQQTLAITSFERPFHFLNINCMQQTYKRPTYPAHFVHKIKRRNMSVLESHKVYSIYLCLRH